MAADGWTTLGELPDGNLFEAHPEDANGQRVLAVKSEYHYPSGVCECVLLASGEYAHFRRGNATRVRPLDFHALLAELDELRTLTHDLLIDRDAWVGRQIGRGEALRAIAALRTRVEDAWGEGGQARKSSLVAGLAAAYGAVEDLGPVRPLPPPERVAERCRALEGALRDLAGAVSRLFQNPAQTFAGVATAGELLKARGAALELLGGTSAGG
jgi:hypothetical protein